MTSKTVHRVLLASGTLLGATLVESLGGGGVGATIAAGAAAGIGANFLHQVADTLAERSEVAGLGTSDWLRNDELERFVGSTLAGTLNALSEASDLSSGTRARLAALSLRAQQNWLVLVAQPELAPLREERLLRLFALTSQELAAAKTVDAETWADFLGILDESLEKEGVGPALLQTLKTPLRGLSSSPLSAAERHLVGVRLAETMPVALIAAASHAFQAQSPAYGSLQLRLLAQVMIEMGAVTSAVLRIDAGAGQLLTRLKSLSEAIEQRASTIVASASANETNALRPVLNTIREHHRDIAGYLQRIESRLDRLESLIRGWDGLFRRGLEITHQQFGGAGVSSGRLHESSLAAQDKIDSEAEATSSINLARALLHAQDFPGATARAEKALTIAREVGNPSLESLALQELAMVKCAQGHTARALELLHLSLRLARQTRDYIVESDILDAIGVAHWHQTSFDEAVGAFEQSLSVSVSLGDLSRQAQVLYSLGRVHDSQSEWRRAMECFDRALILSQQTNQRALEASTLLSTGAVQHSLGMTAEARSALAASVDLSRIIGEKQTEAKSHLNLGRVFVSVGERELALKHTRAAAALFADLQDPLFGYTSSFLTLMEGDGWPGMRLAATVGLWTGRLRGRISGRRIAKQS